MKLTTAMNQQLKIICLLVFSTTLNGCIANMTETHYVLAHDPATDTSNFFKVDFDGTAFFSGAKFSLGEYDRAAVNQIFSETDINREYLSKKIDLVDQDGNRISDLSNQLKSSKISSVEEMAEQLARLNASLQEMIGKLRYSSLEGVSDQFDLDATLASIDVERKLGEAALLSADSGRLIVASSHLRNALGSLLKVNNIVNGRKTVRHFDADGNEIDVINKSVLVFVATDTNKFTHAITQVVESENAQKDLFLAISGSDIGKHELLGAQVNDSHKTNRALVVRIDDQIESSKDDVKLQIEAIRQMAADVAGKVGKFDNALGIRAFANGMGEE